LLIFKETTLFWINSTNTKQIQNNWIKLRSKSCLKHDKQDQQEKAAFSERNPNTTQQQEPVARSPGGPQTKTGQGTDS
jgi:hypothetical protein